MNRIMTFVDGENLCIRGQDLLSDSVSLSEGKYYVRDTFLWMEYPRGYGMPKGVLKAIPSVGASQGDRFVRSTYYTSVFGDNDRISSVRQLIWNCGLNPKVFKKERKQSKAKGVDIALTNDMLSQAYMNNYDTAVLITGDGDYVPLVEEVKRLGKRVVVQFFFNGLSNELKIASDAFVEVSDIFQTYWKEWRNPVAEVRCLTDVKPLVL